MTLALIFPIFAQVAKDTAAVAAEQPGFFSWENLQKILEYGLLVFGVIAGLKNIPFFADFFAAWPKLGVIVNAVLSLCTAWILCLKMPGHDQAFYVCLLTGLGIFLAAAGIHGVIAKLSPDNSTPSVNEARVAKLQGK